MAAPQPSSLDFESLTRDFASTLRSVLERIDQNTTLFVRSIVELPRDFDPATLSAAQRDYLAAPTDPARSVLARHKVALKDKEQLIASFERDLQQRILSACPMVSEADHKLVQAFKTLRMRGQLLLALRNLETAAPMATLFVYDKETQTLRGPGLVDAISVPVADLYREAQLSPTCHVDERDEAIRAVSRKAEALADKAKTLAKGAATAQQQLAAYTAELTHLTDLADKVRCFAIACRRDVAECETRFKATMEENHMRICVIRKRYRELTHVKKPASPPRNADKRDAEIRAVVTHETKALASDGVRKSTDLLFATPQTPPTVPLDPMDVEEPVADQNEVEHALLSMKKNDSETPGDDADDRRPPLQRTKSFREGLAVDGGEKVKVRVIVPANVIDVSNTGHATTLRPDGTVEMVAEAFKNNERDSLLTTTAPDANGDFRVNLQARFRINPNVQSLTVDGIVLNLHVRPATVEEELRKMKALVLPAQQQTHATV